MDPLNVQQRLKSFSKKLTKIQSKEEGVDFHRYVAHPKTLIEDMTTLTEAIVSVIRHPRGTPNKEELEREIEDVVDKIDEQFHAMHQEAPLEVQKNLSSIREHLADKKKGERYRLSLPAIEALSLNEQEYTSEMDLHLKELARHYSENPKAVHQEAALFWLYGFLYREGADTEQIFLQTKKWENYLNRADKEMQALFLHESASALLPIAYETEREEVEFVKDSIEGIRKDPGTKIFDRLEALF